MTQATTIIAAYCLEFYVSNGNKNYRFRYCQLMLLQVYIKFKYKCCKAEKPSENLKYYTTVIRTIEVDI